MAVNACLTPICSVHGLAVTTVEGIGSSQEKLHPVQERIVKAHGSQCGFCTPGIVMSMYALLRNKNKIDYKDIEVALQGNLCRCTGYRPIVEGYKTFTEGWERQYASDGQKICMMGENCCKNKKEHSGNEKLFNKSSFLPYDSTQEPIFPPELKVNFRKYNNVFLLYRGENVIWIQTRGLEELLLIKQKLPESKIVVGNTEVGIETKFKKIIYPVLLTPNNISQLNFCKVTDKSLVIGATTTLTDLQNFLREKDPKVPVKGKVSQTIVEMLHWFAGSQVRNVATMAGNIITASPISDLNPILMASAAVLNVCSKERGCRKVCIDENFFKGYRKTAIDPDEVVLSVEIPKTEEKQYFKAYKQARRRDDDISIVTAAFNVTLNAEMKIEAAKLCYGGMGPTTVCASKTSKDMIGKPWDKELLTSVFDNLTDEFQLHESVPGGMADYRKSLCLSLFLKFYMYVVKDNKLNGISELCDFEDVSIPEPKGSQYFEIRSDRRRPTDAVGLPVPHASAIKQATGEAIYCDDIPHVQGELYLSLIFSARPHAKIKTVNASKALAVPGVEAFFSAADLDKDCNKLGPIIKDEEIFSSETVTSRACVIGAIVAKTESIARLAKTLVDVVYEDLEPVIVTLEDAIERKSFFEGYPRTLRKGETKKGFQESDFVIEGSTRTGAQEHFYLEPFAAFATTKEDEIEIICSTQNPEEMAVSLKAIAM